VVLMPAVEGGEPSRKPNCISCKAVEKEDAGIRLI
jgi:hypothetical protein